PLWNGGSEKETNTSCLQKLGINTAELEGPGDPVNGQHIGGNAVVDFVQFRKAHHFIERVFHDVEKALVHFAFAPEKPLAVLDPFEIADGNASGVAENVRHGEDPFGVDNRVGLPSSRSVGAFTQNSRLDLICVFLGDLIFDGRGNGDFAGLKEHLARAHFCTTAWEFLKRLLLRIHPIDHLRHVKTFFIVKTTTDVREANDFIAGFLHEFRGQGTYVAKTLHHDAAALLLDAEFREGFVAANHDAAAGGFASAT